MGGADNSSSLVGSLGRSLRADADDGFVVSESIANRKKGSFLFSTGADINEPSLFPRRFCPDKIGMTLFFYPECAKDDTTRYMHYFAA
jgi:hypothetical protein